MAELWLILLSCFWGPQELLRPSKKVQIMDSWPQSMPKETKHWVRLVWKKYRVSNVLLWCTFCGVFQIHFCVMDWSCLIWLWKEGVVDKRGEILGTNTTFFNVYRYVVCMYVTYGHTGFQGRDTKLKGNLLNFEN